MAAISIEQVANAGIVGAGGAGFPTHVKLSGQADSVLLNAAECEPLLHKDKEILRAYGEQVLEGMQVVMSAVGAKQGYVGVKGKYSDVIDALTSKCPPSITVHPLADSYPSGDEFILVYDVLHRVIPPGGIPLNVGAVVVNVETALNIAVADQTPVVEKFMPVAGAVANPVTLRVPVGITLAECVEAAGGASVPNPAYMVGGVMMGRLEDNHDALVTKTTGGVIVFPEEHMVIQRRRQTWTQIASIGRSACDQCSFCTERCPRWLLGHPIEPHRAMRSLGFNLVGEANVRGTSFCCECNLCSMSLCPEALDPKNVCVQNKQRLASEGKRWESPPFDPTRADKHLKDRKTPTSRLIKQLGLRQFHNVGPLQPEILSTRRVGIPLKQHIGAACECVVSVGDRVAKGQVVGRVPVKDGKPALGAPVHASIDGTVSEIRDDVVWIQND